MDSKRENNDVIITTKYNGELQLKSLEYYVLYFNDNELVGKDEGYLYTGLNNEDEFVINPEEIATNEGEQLLFSWGRDLEYDTYKVYLEDRVSLSDFELNN